MRNYGDAIDDYALDQVARATVNKGLDRIEHWAEARIRKIDDYEVGLRPRADAAKVVAPKCLRAIQRSSSEHCPGIGDLVILCGDLPQHRGVLHLCEHVVRITIGSDGHHNAMRNVLPERLLQFGKSSRAMRSPG